MSPPTRSTPPNPNPSSPPSNPNLQNDIPPLKTLLPAIFVPIPPTFFDHPPPETRTSQIQQSIHTLETHSSQVRANILALSKQECRRISRDAQIQESLDPGQHGPTRRRVISASEKAEMIANMEASMEGGEGELPRVADFSGWLVRNPREWEEREVLRTVARTMVDLKGFGEHVARIKGGFEDALEREREMERERGKLERESEEPNRERMNRDR